MAAAVCKHAGARHVVITDVIDSRLELAARLGATRTVNVSRESIGDVQKELHMTEGFDVGLEMSGNRQAFNDLLANMCHGGKVSILGIPSKYRYRLEYGDLQYADLEGHLRAGDVRDLVQDVSDDRLGAGYFPGHHPSPGLQGFSARL